MKIKNKLKEDLVQDVVPEEEAPVQDDFPTTLLTSLVSEGWDRIGILKEQISNIKEDPAFKDYQCLTDIIQDLVDAYLVCVGQMECLLHNSDAISDKNDVGVVAIDNVAAVTEPNVSGTQIVANPNLNVPEEKEVTGEIEDNKFVPDEPVEEPVKISVKETPKTVEVDSEYFVDFDEPDDSEKSYTDEDIYDIDEESKVIKPRV